VSPVIFDFQFLIFDWSFGETNLQSKTGDGDPVNSTSHSPHALAWGSRETSTFGNHFNGFPFFFLNGLIGSGPLANH